jgi:hypothetical protein
VDAEVAVIDLDFLYQLEQLTRAARRLGQVERELVDMREERDRYKSLAEQLGMRGDVTLPSKLQEVRHLHVSVMIAEDLIALAREPMMLVDVTLHDRVIQPLRQEIKKWLDGKPKR